MRKFVLPVLAIVAAPSLFAQISNGNFDNWNAMEMFEQPVFTTEVSTSNHEMFFETGQVNVTSADGPTGRTMRLESISINDKVFPAFFLTGAVPQGTGEEIIFGGGVPVSDASVTGVSLDIRYNVSAESTGFVIVQFKKNGTPIGMGNMGPGTMMWPIEGQADWQNISLEFDGSFAEAPDQCVVAVASANLLGDDEPFPAGSYVEVDNLSFINSTDAFPGGDFENWDDVESILTPEGVIVELNPWQTTFERTEDAFTGMWALALHTVAEGENVNTGKAIFAGGTFDQVQPNVQIGSQDLSLSFAYKFEGSNDKAQATVSFYQANTEGDLEIVHQKHFQLNPGVTDNFSDGINTGPGGLEQGWNAIEYNFREEPDMNSLNPTHMTIAFESGTWMDGNTPKNGSTLIIDDVALSGALNSRNQLLQVKANIIATPNPTAHRVTFKLGQPRTGFVRVFNNQGVQVDIKEFQSVSDFVYDMSHIKAGVFTFRFQHNAGVDVIKVVKI